MVGVHVHEEVQHHPPDVHHQEHSGDAPPLHFHTVQPHFQSGCKYINFLTHLKIINLYWYRLSKK